jgi:hypothetical protein
MENWKRTLINLLGVLTTAATLVVIYFVLFMTGIIKTLDKHILTEFALVLVLITSVKMFWYSSVESSYYSSDEYRDKINATSQRIDESVVNANDFDEFISYENIHNYNKVILNKCEGLTINNYKYRWFDNLERMFRWPFACKDKRYYVEKFVRRVERKAMRVHKLSGSNILSFSTTRYGLTDDRNPVKQAKLRYIISGIVVSTVLTFITAMLSFSPNPNTDTRAAVIKFISYTIQIMYAILQTILNANTSVKHGIRSYCNNIITIIDKYDAYKANPQKPTILNYMEGLTHGNVINNTDQTREGNINYAC